jgi:hypothetical protein
VKIGVVAVDVNTRAVTEVTESAKAKGSALRVLRRDSKKAFSFARTDLITSSRSVMTVTMTRIATSLDLDASIKSKRLESSKCWLL